MPAETSSPSGIPQLDRLVELLATAEPTPPGAVGSAFQALDEALGYLYGSYEFELQFFEYREDLARACDDLLECFQKLKPLQADIRDEISLGNKDTALKLLDELREQLQTLFELLANLKRLVDQGPQYCELPYTQELLRVAYLYLEEKLPIAAVQSRLDVFCTFHDNLELELENMRPSPSEEKAFEANKADLEEAMAAQIQGIEDLDLALERESEDGIREALELLAAAGSTLVEFYETLREADQEPDTLSCFRCGTKNSAQARLCGGCSAVLPRSEGLATSTMEWNEGGADAGSSRPEEELKIIAAVEAAVDAADPSPLLGALSEYRQKLEQGRSRLNKLQSPPKDIPKDHLEVLQQGKQGFTEALTGLAEALDVLEEAAPRLDTPLLQRGLEQLSEGFQQFREFEDAFQKAEKLG